MLILSCRQFTYFSLIFHMCVQWEFRQSAAGNGQERWQRVGRQGKLSDYAGWDRERERGRERMRVRLRVIVSEMISRSQRLRHIRSSWNSGIVIARERSISHIQNIWIKIRLPIMPKQSPLTRTPRGVLFSYLIGWHFVCSLLAR